MYSVIMDNKNCGKLDFPILKSQIIENFDSRSDIDIAIEGLSPRLYLKALAFLSDYFKREINLIPLETCDSSLKEVIYSDGRLVYSSQ